MTKKTSLPSIIACLVVFFAGSSAPIPVWASDADRLHSASAAISAIARVEQPLGTVDSGEKSILGEAAFGSALLDSSDRLSGVNVPFLQIICFPNRNDLIIQIVSSSGKTYQFNPALPAAGTDGVFSPGTADESIALNLSSLSFPGSPDPAIVTIIIADSAI
jgi:hypothetical protein